MGGYIGKVAVAFFASILVVWCVVAFVLGIYSFSDYGVAGRCATIIISAIALFVTASIAE